MKNKFFENLILSFTSFTLLLILISNIVFIFTGRFYNIFTGYFIVSIYITIILVLIKMIIKNKKNKKNKI